MKLRPRSALVRGWTSSLFPEIPCACSPFILHPRLSPLSHFLLLRSNQKLLSPLFLFGRVWLAPKAGTERDIVVQGPGGDAISLFSFSPPPHVSAFMSRRFPSHLHSHSRKGNGFKKCQLRNIFILLFSL